MLVYLRGRGNAKGPQGWQATHIVTLCPGDPEGTEKYGDFSSRLLRSQFSMWGCHHSGGSWAG